MTQQRVTPINVYIILIMGMLSISFAPILVRLAQGENIPSLVIAMARLVLSTLVFTPLVLMRHWSQIRQISRRDLGLMLTAGVFLAIHFVSWNLSLEYTTVLVSVVFVTSSPLWVALLEWLLLKQRLPQLVIIGLIVAIGGGLMIGLGGESGDSIAAAERNDLLGGGLALIGAVAVAVYLIVARNIQQNQKLPIIPYLWMVYGSAGLTLVVVVILTGTPITGYSLEGYGWLIAMTIFPQLLGHSSLNYATGYLPATIVSMMTQLEPVGSAILAYFIFSELPLPLQIFGSLIVLAGVMLANYGQRKQKRDETT